MYEYKYHDLQDTNISDENQQKRKIFHKLNADQGICPDYFRRHLQMER